MGIMGLTTWRNFSPRAESFHVNTCWWFSLVFEFPDVCFPKRNSEQSRSWSVNWGVCVSVCVFIYSCSAYVLFISFERISFQMNSKTINSFQTKSVKQNTNIWIYEYEHPALSINALARALGLSESKSFKSNHMLSCRQIFMLRCRRCIILCKLKVKFPRQTKHYTSQGN
jgi:hypothetical protein